MGPFGPAILAFALVFGSAGAGGAGPAGHPAPAEPIREDGVLGLDALRLPRSGKVCTGASIEMLFRVSNVSQGLEIPLPVVEAMVNVTDDQGMIRETQTNGAGLARFNWNTQREGQVRFTVTARKTYYVDAQPLTFSVQVEPCDWAMAINYREEFAIISEVALVVGASVSWHGKVSITSTNADSGTSQVEIAGGSGTYQFYASDKIQAPVHVSLDPAVSGAWNLKGDGTVDNGVIQLDVGTTEESYPQMVFIKVTDYGPNNIEVHYKPPAPYIDGKGFFIEANKLGHLTFPTSGGAVSLSSGMSTYFWTDSRTAYSLTVMLYPLKQMTGSTGRPLAYVGTVR